MCALCEDAHPFWVVCAPTISPYLSGDHRLLQYVAHNAGPYRVIGADVELVHVDVVGLEAVETRVAGAANELETGIHSGPRAHCLVT